MSEHRASIRRKSEGDFAKGRFSREHTWSFDGGMTIAASSSPSAVPQPYSNPANVDPEEAFVAAISSCHMLTFLAIAARKRLVVDAYDDHAVGVMAPGPTGRLAITQVTLHPTIVWNGPEPDAATIKRIHEVAHRECFIANSVTTEITVAAST